MEGGGVFFKIWEPVATEVHLFLDNDSAPILMHQDYSPHHPKLSHIYYLEQAQSGDLYHYKFMKNGNYEVLEVANHEYLSSMKIDPMARLLSYQAKGGYYNGYINSQSQVHHNSDFSWKHDKKIHLQSLMENYNNWIIYQIWPLTFNPKIDNGKYRGGNFNDITQKIDYLANLGINAVEFLPIHETRFHASWGYALDSLILIEKNYGTINDFKNLVDQLHSKNIRVILDIVINHVNNGLLREPLSAKIDTSKYYKGNTDWGPRPDFDNPMVQKWIIDSLLYLIREFHIDGFRFDMTKYIYQGNQGGTRLLQELNALFKMENPAFYSSAEELPDSLKVTQPLSEGGMAFDSQWNDLFKNFFENNFHYYRAGFRNLSNLENLQKALQGFGEDQYGQKIHFGPPRRTVNYLGSHDFIGNKNPMLRIVSDFDRDEWTKEKEDNTLFFRVRPLENPIETQAKFRQIHNYFTHSVGKMAYSILFTKPGAILFFQGEEMANDINIENEWNYLAPKNGAFPSKNIDINRYVGSHRMVWEYLTPQQAPLDFLNPAEQQLFRGYHQLFRDLIKLRAENPKFSENNAENVHLANHLLSYEVNAGNDTYFVVANFSYDKGEEWIYFPGNSSDWWEEIINSSDRKYGNANNTFTNIINQRGGRSNHLRLAASSVAIFKKTKTIKTKQDLFLVGTFNNWKADQQSRLVQENSGPIYSTQIKIEASGQYDFKLGTSDWDIELGRTNSFDRYSSLSYRPHQPNVPIYLESGNLLFRFNVETFVFEFVKI